MSEAAETAAVASRPIFRWAVLALVVMAVLPYLPFMALPPISDDYVQIDLARAWGPVAEWPKLAADPLYRCRATSLVLTYWTEQLFGLSAQLLQLQSIVLHVIATLLLAAFGWWRRIGWPLGFTSAAFFAFHEGHQEAVVWYAALPELLVFVFGVMALHCWIAWCENARRTALAYAGAFVFFVLALLSKESAVSAAGLMAAVCVWTRVPWRRAIAGLAPFALLSIGYAALIFAAKQNHLHLNDGTFSLSAPVGAVAARSILRLLWIWGIPAVAMLWWRRKSDGWVLAVAAVWMVVTILPYSFLTYMPRVPSRHVYWASAGLGMIVGGAWLVLWNQGRTRWLAAAAAAAMIVHNLGWLWWKKYPQYVRRAEPTESFIRYVRTTEGPIRMKCFPYSPEIAERAARVRLGRSIETIWDPDAAEGERVYCDPSRP